MSNQNTAQTMFVLASAAEIGGIVTYTNDYDTALTIWTGLIAELGALDLMNSKGWSVVWGPAIYSFPINNGQYVDNVIYVARNGTSNDYAIAIAGTNAASVADWILEDFNVIPVPWSLIASTNDGTKPNISLATYTGLSIILNISPPSSSKPGDIPIPGAGQTLMKFLGTITGGGPINLYTTGHSLGGALSPTLALALADMADQWDPKRNATLQPYAFAGPTPGDTDFNSHFKNQIPAGLQRIWNKLDVVPHAWDTTDLSALPTLYGQTVTDVQNAVNTIVAVIGNVGYAPVNDAQPAFSGEQQNPSITTTDDYNTEAAYQHTTAYSLWAGMPVIAAKSFKVRGGGSSGK